LGIIPRRFFAGTPYWTCLRGWPSSMVASAYLPARPTGRA